MDSGLTKEQYEELRRTARESKVLTDRFYKELDAIWSSRVDYSPERMIDTMMWSVFMFARRRLGDEAARDLFAQVGPWSKRQIQERRKYWLVIAYGEAGKPNAKTGKFSMAAFARAVAKQNEGRPKERRLGSGTTNAENMLRDLKRALKQKKYRDACDHWYERAGKHKEATERWYARLGTSST
jgi:hypothetical protein